MAEKKSGAAGRRSGGATKRATPARRARQAAPQTRASPDPFEPGTSRRVHPGSQARRSRPRIRPGQDLRQGKTKGTRRGPAGPPIPGSKADRCHVPAAAEAGVYQSVPGGSPGGEPVRLKKVSAAEVSPETLYSAGLIGKPDSPVKLLGTGDADRAYTVRGVALSAPARAKIEAAGGKIEG